VTADAEPADGLRESDRTDVTGFTPVTADAEPAAGLREVTGATINPVDDAPHRLGRAGGTTGRADGLDPVTATASDLPSPPPLPPRPPVAISLGSHSIGRGWAGPPAAGGCRKTEGLAPVAKVSPIEFFRQVRAESAKIVWPTRKQTVSTGIMVLIMTTILAVFFFGVDTVFQAIVKFALKLVS
jgi:preprotein translocase subunit SecE